MWLYTANGRGGSTGIMQPATSDLHEQSTWKLFFLGSLTYGVYAAYYCQRQTLRLNPHLAEGRNISTDLGRVIVGLNWVSLALFVMNLGVEDGHAIEPLSGFVDTAAGIAFVVWGFTMRGRINELFRSRPGEPLWFHGFWTFCFSPFYFNYKINTLVQHNMDFAVPPIAPPPPIDI